MCGLSSHFEISRLLFAEVEVTMFNKITTITLLESDFKYIEHNKALVPDGCFFNVSSDNVVSILPSFMYLKKFDIFNDYKFKISNEIFPCNDKHNTKFHRLYVSLFNMSHLPNSRYLTITFTKDDIELILRNCNRFAYNLKIKQSPILPTLQYPLFLKTEMTSGKNDVQISKINNETDLLNRMYSVKSWALEYEEFLNSDKTDFNFFIMPWIDILQEYRCFVYERRLVSVCPQKFWECCQPNINIVDLLQLQKSFIDEYNHDNYCIDVYQNSPSGPLEVIETNEWFNSGPGLFSYKEFQNISTDDVIMKYVTK